MSLKIFRHMKLLQYPVKTKEITVYNKYLQTPSGMHSNRFHAAMSTSYIGKRINHNFFFGKDKYFIKVHRLLFTMNDDRIKNYGLGQNTYQIE